MKRVILGTAGHIDHGKTELIRALTGIDTDRLKEEKERGISIELGFAYLDVGDDTRVGIIDVPGHEKFVRQMVAGSGGVDLAALVIALDEGVMPQTVEHLDILELLGIHRGIVVLTKLDLVDEELAMLAEEDAASLVEGTFLENAPMIRVSSRTGEGIEELREALRSLCADAQEKRVHGLFRLPVDRVFVMKGHGTVVAGTLISGALKTGDDIEVLPDGLKSSVRSMQSHNRQEEEAIAGERVAVNLRGVEQSQMHRGAVLTHPGEFQPSHIIDVELHVLLRSPGPLKNRQKLRLHHYTTEVEARLIIPDSDEIPPGGQAAVQLRTSAPIVPSSGDRFVIRALSPSITLGGGVILNPRGLKLRARTAKRFQEIDREDHAAIVASLVRSAGLEGCKQTELLGLSGLPAKRLDKVLEKLKNSHTLVRFDPAENRLIHQDFIAIVQQKMLDRVGAFHKAQPLKEGIPKQELRSTVPGGDKLFRKVMQILTDSGELSDQGDVVRASTHKVQLKDDEKGLRDDLLKMIVGGGNAPPVVKEMTTRTGSDVRRIRSLLGVLEKENKVVKVKEDIYFSIEFVEETKKKLADFIKKEGGITPSQFHEVTGSSRKYNIPLLEYFDRERFTIRVGDQRVLRGSDT